MDLIIELSKSDIGVAIAWICGIAGLAMSFFTSRENRKLKIKIISLENINIALKEEAVTLNGDKNIYTKHNSGGMKIEM